jgi:hypothetical protein
LLENDRRALHQSLRRRHSSSEHEMDSLRFPNRLDTFLHLHEEALFERRVPEPRPEPWPRWHRANTIQRDWGVSLGATQSPRTTGLGCPPNKAYERCRDSGGDAPGVGLAALKAKRITA